jgi:hypothetical protein
MMIRYWLSENATFSSAPLIFKDALEIGPQTHILTQLSKLCWTASNCDMRFGLFQSILPSTHKKVPNFQTIEFNLEKLTKWLTFNDIVLIGWREQLLLL